MAEAAAKMNLRPQERRLVALVVIVLFAVLNVAFVWPHFGDWGKLEDRQNKAEKTLQIYRNEIARVNAYQLKLRELESAGSSVVPQQQELDLVRKVDDYARLSRLSVIGSIPGARQSNTETNRFFEEQFVTLHATCDNEELINFLVSLTTTNSLIRVKDLTLKPADAGVTRLDANMTLVASYQRKTPARSQPSSARTTNVPVSPAASPTPRSSSLTNKPALPSRTISTNRTVPTTKPLVSPKARPTNQPARKP